MGVQYYSLTFIALACGMKLFKDDIIGIISFLWDTATMVLAIGGLGLLRLAHERNRTACGCPEWGIKDNNRDVIKSGSHDPHDHNESSPLGDDETVCDDPGVLPPYHQVPLNIDTDIKIRVGMWLRVDEECQDGEESRYGGETCDEDLSAWENHREYYLRCA